MTVKNRLKEILDKKGIKQIWLAEQINISPKTLNNIIGNKYNTSLEVALKISKILDIDIQEIFELSEEEK
jgi:putative transcriptional regulator